MTIRGKKLSDPSITHGGTAQATDLLYALRTVGDTESDVSLLPSGLLSSFNLGDIYQPLNANLTEWAEVNPSNNGKSLVEATDYAAMRGLLDLEAGTDFNAYSANLAEWSGINPSADGASLVSAADYDAMRVLLNISDVVSSASSFAADNAIVRADGTGKDVQSSSATISDGGTLTLLPTGGSRNQALIVNQSLSGSGADSANTILISSDDAVMTDDGFGAGLIVSHAFGGSSMRGGRHGLWSYATFTGASSGSNGNRNYVSAAQWLIVNAGDGGGSGTEQGGFFACNPFVSVGASAAHLLNVSAGEVNVAMAVGSSALHKTIWQLVGHVDDKVQGTITDAMLAFGAQTGNVKTRDGILFTNIYGIPPISTTGTLIRTSGSATVANGIDLSSYTISTSAFKSTGFNVSGSGGITATGSVAINDAASPQVVLTVASAGQAGFQWNVGLQAFLVDTYVADVPILFRVNSSEVARMQATGINIASGGALFNNYVQVLSARDTGWGAMTGTPDKATAYATGSVTLAQLAGRVMAMQTALTTHGILGA